MTPADTLFRDGLCTPFPRKKVSDEQIQLAQQREKQLKQEREIEKNSSKYRQYRKYLDIGDNLLIY